MLGDIISIFLERYQGLCKGDNVEGNHDGDPEVNHIAFSGKSNRLSLGHTFNPCGWTVTEKNSTLSHRGSFMGKLACKVQQKSYSVINSLLLFLVMNINTKYSIKMIYLIIILWYLLHPYSVYNN